MLVPKLYAFFVALFFFGGFVFIDQLWVVHKVKSESRITNLGKARTKGEAQMLKRLNRRGGATASHPVA